MYAFAEPSRLNNVARQNQIRKLSLFGSALREDFNEQSDLDMLVEFEPDARVGLLRFVAMQEELSALFGRAVDLHTPASLSRHFRDEVMQAAQVLYAAGE